MQGSNQTERAVFFRVSADKTIALVHSEIKSPVEFPLIVVSSSWILSCLQTNQFLTNFHGQALLAFFFNFLQTIAVLVSHQLLL